MGDARKGRNVYRWPHVLGVLLVTWVLAATVAPNAASAASAAALREKGRELCREGKFEAAAQEAESAVELDEREHGTQHADTAASLNVLSAAYLGLGRYQQALDVAQRALAIRETASGPEHLDTAESLNDVGVVYLYLKQPERAGELIKRALAIRKQQLPENDQRIAESESNFAAVLSSRAVVFEQNGDRQSAVDALRQAVEGFERALRIKEAAGGNDASVCTTRSNLSATYLRLAKLSPGKEQAALNQKAEETAISAKACAQGSNTTDQGLGLATARIHQAWAMWNQNVATNRRNIIVLDQMRDLFKQAAKTREDVLGAEHPETTNAQVMLATASQGLGDYRQALELMERALAAEDRVLASFVAAGNEQQNLVLLQRAQGHYWAALSMIQRHFAKDPAAVRLGLELVLRRKGIILDMQTRIRDALAQQLDAGSADSWRRLVGLQAELSKLLVQGPRDDAAQYKQQVDSLRAEIAEQEQTLGRRNPVIAEELAQRDVTAAAVAARLPKDAVLVEYVRIRDWDDQSLQWAKTDRYLGFALTPDNKVMLVDLGDADEIDKALRQAVAAIEDPAAFRDPVANQQKTDVALTNLYRTLVEPLTSAVGNREHWILSPDGEINKAPFPALRTPSGKYVVEERVLSLVTSGRDLLRNKTSSQQQLAMLMVANPTFESGQTQQPAASRRRRRSGEAAQSRGRFRHKFGALPGAAQEAQVIVPLVRGHTELLEGESATEPAVWDTVIESPPRILHFATHAYFDGGVPVEPADLNEGSGGGASGRRADDPLMRSFVALAGVNKVQEILPEADDGVLYAAEVAEMDLHGTELVVLSACQTALGDVRNGEGVYGLRRAFVLAGARDLVMSLWPVDDDETRNLMEQFYRAYGDGSSPAKALQQAQIHTLRKIREKNQASSVGQPVAQVTLWAPFVIQQNGV